MKSHRAEMMLESSPEILPLALLLTPAFLACPTSWPQICIVFIVLLFGTAEGRKLGDGFFLPALPVYQGPG